MIVKHVKQDADMKSDKKVKIDKACRQDVAKSLSSMVSKKPSREDDSDKYGDNRMHRNKQNFLDNNKEELPAELRAVMAATKSH